MAEGKIFHKICFRCDECFCALGKAGFGMIDRQVFCKPHFKQAKKNLGGDPDLLESKSEKAEPSVRLWTPFLFLFFFFFFFFFFFLLFFSFSFFFFFFFFLFAQYLTLLPLLSLFVKAAAMKLNIVNSKCAICDKTVYPVDKISADNKDFHKFCFRCKECKKVLILGNYAAIQGVFYCKPHFNQMLKNKDKFGEKLKLSAKKSDVSEAKPAPSANPAPAPDQTSGATEASSEARAEVSEGKPRVSFDSAEVSSSAAVDDTEGKTSIDLESAEGQAAAEEAAEVS